MTRHPEVRPNPLAGIVLALITLALATGCAPSTDPPRELFGLEQTRVVRDSAALGEVRALHGRGLRLEWAVVAEYGDGAATLWVAGVRDADAALRDMTARIGEGGSPFTPRGRRTVHGREVHELEGLGQRHFYFAAGARVVWLAMDRPLPDQVLEEALRAYR